MGVRREPLNMIGKRYDPLELLREGFPQMTINEFLVMFCEHNRCALDRPVTRIEFEYVE